VLAAVQSVHTPWLDFGASLVTLFGQAEVAAGIALGLAVARFRHYPRAAIVPLCIAVTVIIEVALKILVPQTPPPHALVRSVEIVPFLQLPFAHSFPSGHVARLAFLLRITSVVPTWLFALAIVVMMLTRIYLAEHWLSDTVGGLVLGVGVANIARRIA
jgi:membrane-associated phospholipid phosphatase